jgi:hypothetical protein
MRAVLEPPTSGTGTSRSRRLAASSIGIGAGFYLAGVPRLITATAVTLAMIIGAAIVVRPTKPYTGTNT